MYWMISRRTILSKCLWIGTVYSITIFALNSCKKETKEVPIEKSTVFKLLNSESTGIDFENTLEYDQEFNVYKYRNYYNGGGVTIGDINNDSLPDIYFIANQKENRLY